MAQWAGTLVLVAAFVAIAAGACYVIWRLLRGGG